MSSALVADPVAEGLVAELVPEPAELSEKPDGKPAEELAELPPAELSEEPDELLEELPELSEDS